MDWSKIPDILAVASLACAFASILRRNRTPGYRIWLIGWILIDIHFIGFSTMGLPGVFGLFGLVIGISSLVAAGIFFMWATVPSETAEASRFMGAIVMVSLVFYAVLDCLHGIPSLAYDYGAFLISVGPLAIAVLSVRQVQHTLRWVTVGMQFALGVTLIILRHVPWGSPDLELNALLFSVYMGCCIYFWYTHRRPSAGSIITIIGFFAWASVFVIAPTLAVVIPSLHLENEAWNLPKYVVAVGMLLLLLETQIERSEYLALHDDLTKLANRRLFQDRLAGAVERARRSGSYLALLQIDLDRFKEVNDTHGHHVGDLLLKTVARLVEARIRRSDTLARTGGDEFSLILEETPSRKDAESVAINLAEILREPLNLAGHSISIGASIGVAIYPSDAEDAESLCITADAKMYRVKQRNQDSIPDPLELSHKAPDQELETLSS